MNFYNSFNEMFSNNTKQDMTVFNTVSAIAEFDNGNSRRAYWDYGGDTVWFEFYDAEDDDYYDEDFGARVKDNELRGTSCELNTVDVGTLIDDVETEISRAIDDLYHSSGGLYDNAVEYAYNNVQKVDDVVFSILKAHNLKNKGGSANFDSVGKLDNYSDGTSWYEIDPTFLEPINAGQFEEEHYQELSERLAKFCSGVTANSWGYVYTGGVGGSMFGPTWGIGKFIPD